MDESLINLPKIITLEPNSETLCTSLYEINLEI